MALVKCPECGKENVSDSADACPNCGYGIKNFFQKKKESELNRRRYEEKLKSIPKPEEPSFSWGTFWTVGWIGFLGFFFGVPVGFTTLIIFGIIAYLIARSDYKEELKKYQLAMTDFEKYQRQELMERQIRAARKAAEEAAKPRCPQCNSTNVERISTVSRATSIAMTGLASKKIGKQYKCKNCKHMW